MRRLALRTLAVLSVATVALAAVGVGGFSGMDPLWPLLLGAAVALAPRPPTGRISGFAFGVAAGWAAVALRVAVLPDTPGGRVLTGALLLAALVTASLASRGRVPLWATLIGAAGFLALVDSTLAVDPTGFAADRLNALGTLLLGAGLGVAAAVTARALAARLWDPPPRRAARQRRCERPAEPAAATTTEERP